MKVALAQIRVIAGHPDRNFETIKASIEEAKKKKLDIVVFPEMAVPGYMIGDEWENERFIRDCLSYNDDIKALSEDICIIWGNVAVDEGKIGEDGRLRKYNASYIAQDGSYLSNGVFEGRSYKSLLPKYREFDDERYFYSMVKLADERGVKLEELLRPFDVRIGEQTRKIGLMLCEDMWCADYTHNPAKILIENGAETLINISCSPWTWRKNDKRHRVVAELMGAYTIPFLYCNNVGTQNNGKDIYLFDGASSFYTEHGALAKEAEAYAEVLFEVDLKKDKVKKTKVANSVERDIAELYDGLIYGIKDFFQRLGRDQVVIGLSGGVDSAVVATLLAQAIGAENVHGVNLPSKFNSNTTISIARKLAENLDIWYEEVPIQESVDLTLTQLTNLDFKRAKSKDSKKELNITRLVKENIQARDRGSRVIAAIASALDAVFTNNGNKTEISLGYATLYGDVNGAFAPIGDLYKKEVYHLAEYINNRFGELIPKEIFKVVPSAELSEEQNVDEGKGDPINYYYHDQLMRAFVEFRRDPEIILEWYIEGSLDEHLHLLDGTVKDTFANAEAFIADLEHKWRTYKINIFKRIQSPPIIAVSRRAFGFDLREAQNGWHFTRRYGELKREVLKKA